MINSIDMEIWMRLVIWGLGAKMTNALPFKYNHGLDTATREINFYEQKEDIFVKKNIR